uniref:Uncharacterized protein n=1 Tax=Glossina pallidipes TaxID=7398 RepID=A0A1B0A048_GLOPL
MQEKKYRVVEKNVVECCPFFTDLMFITIEASAELESDITELPDIKVDNKEKLLGRKKKANKVRLSKQLCIKELHSYLHKIQIRGIDLVLVLCSKRKILDFYVATLISLNQKR